MIKDIIDLLNASDWYNQSENIDIAKGKYKASKNLQDVKEQLKRVIYGK